MPAENLKNTGEAQTIVLWIPNLVMGFSKKAELHAFLLCNFCKIFAYVRLAVIKYLYFFSNWKFVQYAEKKSEHFQQFKKK